MKDKYTVLVVLEDDDLLANASAVLEELGHRIVLAKTSHEARLKYANEEFHMAILNTDTKGFKGLDFVENVRRKEKMRSVQDKMPILIVADKPDEFSRVFATMDNIKFLDSPFSQNELKTKLLTFGANSDVIASNTKKIAKDEFLIEEGGTSHEMYWIISGSFAISKMNQEKQQIVIGEVLPGELVGEMSFLDNLPRSASVTAIEDSEVLSIPHKKFIDVLDSQPRWFRTLMQTLSERLRNADLKIVDNKTDNKEKNDSDDSTS